MRDQACNIAKNPKYDGYQGGLASMAYKTFDKKLLLGVLKMRIYMSGQQLAEHLYKSVIRKFKKKKYSRLLKTIFGALILLICN